MRTYMLFLAVLPVAVLAAEPCFIGAGKEFGAKPAIVEKTFVNPKEVRAAKWRVTGLGVFEPQVNGYVVGDGVLMPGYTHFSKRRHEIELDVTRQLHLAAGATNKLSSLVTSGWWCDAIAGKNGGTWPAFRGILEVEYCDGTRSELVTDDSWMATTDVPVVMSGIWEGQCYDACKELDISTNVTWRAAKISNEFKGEVSPRVGPPVSIRGDRIFGPAHFTLKSGETNVVDFGQNCAAVPVIVVNKAAPGTKIVLRLAEILNDGVKGHHGDGPKGSVYLANMRGAGARVEYACRGDKQEEFAPLQTFYGYRYAEISADGEVEGVLYSLPVSSVAKAHEHGWIATGDKDVNRLVKNAYWGMLSNYLSVPTDCPQRTERYGWTGDTQVFAKTGAYFADIRSFMAKWMQDVRDSQEANGVVPLICPIGSWDANGPIAGWSDAAVIVPWTMWKYLGDDNIVRENWDVMEKYVAAVAKNDYRSKRGDWLLCDWLSFEKLATDNKTRWRDNTLTEDHLSYQNFLNACHLLQDCRMMKEMAAVAGRSAEEFDELEKRTHERIMSTWFKEGGTLVELFDGMQTPLLFAIKLELGDRAKNAGRLVANIHNNGDRLATGFLGTPILCEVLSDIGEDELAYTLLLQHDFPSWLYSVDQGATTIWERWNGYTKEKGFGPVGMNSFNHYSYGAVVAWLFEHAAGIQPDPNGGWRHFTIAPKPDRRLGYLDARFGTEYGAVEVSWWYDTEEKLHLRYSIPEGSSAKVILPNGRTLESAAGSFERVLVF